MPIFEYKCSDCGEITEFLEKVNAKTLRKCEYCGSGELKKQFSVFSPGVSQGGSKRCRGCSDQSCPHSG